MTIKEITELRKSGHLQEALEAAEKELAQNINVYTVGGVFWCLNDLYKQQNSSDAKATVERMQALYDDHCTGDDFMLRALASATRRTLPHSREIKEAVENAREGVDAITAHQQASVWYNEGQLDRQLYPDFGWLIYYALKQTPVGEYQKRKTLLNQYLKLELPRPEILHSLILREAVKIEQNTPLQFRMRDFIRIWGLENLREEDWEQYRTDEGNISSSLVEKLIAVYAKELKTDRVESPEDFSQLVDKALIKYPKNQNMPYFKATVLISQGKVQEALTHYKNMILQTPSKFYLWEKTAELVEDIDTKIGLLCKALTCGADDEFIGGVRLRLAAFLYNKGLLKNAKCELEKYRATYQKKGWNLKQEFWQLYNLLGAVEADTDNTAIYAEYAVKADEFIYSSLPTVVAVKVAESHNDDRKRPGRKILTWILRTEKETIRVWKPAKFRLNNRTPNGAIFDVKLHDGKVVWIKEHTGAVTEPWLKEMSGEIHLRTDRKGRNYAIISGSYISPDLLKGLNEGQRVRILSVQQTDGRWSAVKIMKTNSL